MTINHTVGTRYISSAPPTRLIFITLVVISFAFGLSHVHAQEDSAVLYPGTYQAEDSRIKLPDDAQIVAIDGANGEQAVKTSNATFAANGTDVIVRWYFDPMNSLSAKITGDRAVLPVPGDTLWMRDRNVAGILPSDGTDNIPYQTIGENVKVLSLKDGWITAVIAHSTVSQEFHIDAGYAVPLVETNDPQERNGLQIDSIIVLDRTAENLFPYIAAIGITLGMTLFVLISALRERWRR